MHKKMTIEKAIKREFPIVNSEDSLEVAVNKMKESNVSVLAVKVSEELIGLVTLSDIMYSLSNGDDFQDTKISSFMTKCEFNTSHETRNPCIQLDEDEEAISAVKVMYETGVNHLLVSGVDGKIVGIVSSLDIVKLFSTVA